MSKVKNAECQECWMSNVNNVKCQECQICPDLARSVSVPSNNWKNSICFMCHIWCTVYYKWRYQTYWKGYQKISPSSAESSASSIPMLMLFLTFCVCIAFSSSSSNIICLIAGSVYVMMSHQINLNYNLTNINFEIKIFVKCTKLSKIIEFNSKHILTWKKWKNKSISTSENLALSMM